MVGKVGTYVWKANVNTQTPLNSEIDSDSSQPSKEVSLQRQRVPALLAGWHHHHQVRGPRSLARSTEFGHDTLDQRHPLRLGSLGLFLLLAGAKMLVCLMRGLCLSLASYFPRKPQERYLFNYLNYFNIFQLFQ